jgi:hypothetical protein
MTAETLNLLRWHAGLEKTGPDDKPSIATVTWKTARQKDAIDRATADVLLLLEQVNHDLNGAKPSEISEKASAISRQVVFVIEELRRLLKEAAGGCDAGPDRDALTRAEARIGYAWNAVIAGDIDNVVTYADEQSWGKT